MSDMSGLAPPKTPEGWAPGNAPGFFTRVQTPLDRSVKQVMAENRLLKEALDKTMQRLTELEICVDRQK